MTSQWRFQKPLNTETADSSLDNYTQEDFQSQQIKKKGHSKVNKYKLFMYTYLVLQNALEEKLQPEIVNTWEILSPRHANQRRRRRQ